MCRGGGSGESPVAPVQNEWDAVDGPVSARDFDERADHVADLVVQEAVAEEIDADFAGPRFDLGVVQRADGGRALVAGGGETGEVVRTDECFGRGAHRFEVERMPDVPGAAMSGGLDGACARGVDAIAIELANGAAGGVEIGRRLAKMNERNVVGKVVSDRERKVVGRDRAGGLEICDLAAGMDARVGAAGAENGEWVSADAPNDVFDGFLHGALTGLALPAVEVGPVVRERDSDVSLHGKTWYDMRAGLRPVYRGFGR